MKKEDLFNIIGEVDEQKIEAASRAMSSKKNNHLVLMKYVVMAACLALIILAGAATLPKLTNNNRTSSAIDNEHKYESGYFYNVDEGVYSTYIGGKVITEDKITEKITEVSLTAGWKNAEGEWATTEKLRGEVYTINGIPNDVAVAIKFLDKGEALTTTHYYVIMNPKADLSSVSEYIIIPDKPSNTEGDIIPE